MKLVSENINFERGMDPISSMDIGMFNFDIEFSGDIENLEDGEKRIAKKWNYNGVKILEVKGNADEDSSELYFKLSDGDQIVFKQRSQPGHSRPDKPDYAKISISNLGIKDFEVFDEWLDELGNGSIIGAIMKMYEDIKDGKMKIHETLDFERGMNPKSSMKIGIPTWETLREDDLIECPQKIGVDNDNRISELYDINPELPAGTIMQVRELDDASTKEWVLRYVYFSNMEDYKMPDELSSINFQDRFGYIIGTPKQFRNKFKLLSRGINESLDFERGQDPKNAMNIGEKALDKKIIEETEWELPQDLIHQNFNIIKVIRNYKGEPILMLKTKSDGDGDGRKFISMAPNYRSDYYQDSEESLAEVKFYIDGYSGSRAVEQVIAARKVSNESLNFERRINPKSTMNIGKRSMIETWLKKYDLYEDAIIDKNLIINIPEKVNLVVDLKKKHIEELPPYIQFGKVYGGFDISDNNLKTLRGCPTYVLETDKLKGNFKCHSNQLTSLEFAPKKIDGNFIGYLNPGKFIRKDVTKVCKVKGGIIWVDESREINESMDFQRNEDPMGNMDIGFHAQVKTWFKSYGIFDPEKESLYFEYRINKNGTIDVLEDLNLVGAHIDNFPYFICFNKIYGSFYVANNIFTSLEGFPKEVDGDLSIYSDQPKAKKWKESEIRKKIKVKGTVWN